MLCSLTSSLSVSWFLHQMWGHGRSHIDLSSGSSEDPSPVLLHHPLCVWSSAQYCQRGQCGPRVSTGAPALSQVGNFQQVALIYAECILMPYNFVAFNSGLTVIWAKTSGAVQVCIQWPVLSQRGCLIWPVSSLARLCEIQLHNGSLWEGGIHRRAH